MNYSLELNKNYFSVHSCKFSISHKISDVFRFFWKVKMFSYLGWFVWRFHYLGVIIATFAKLTFAEITPKFCEIEVSLVTWNFAKLHHNFSELKFRQFCVILRNCTKWILFCVSLRKVNILLCWKPYLFLM